MTARMMIFDDGSKLSWVDKETIRYDAGDKSALLWIDFEPGLLKRGRILKLSSLEKWSGTDCHRQEITENERLMLIEKVRAYLGNTPLRVE